VQLGPLSLIFLGLPRVEPASAGLTYNEPIRGWQGACIYPQDTGFTAGDLE
jgi:hypothetical protein